MRLVRYMGATGPAWGTIEGDEVRAIADPFADSLTPGEVVGRLADLRLLAPCQPTKIVGFAANTWEVNRRLNLPVPSGPDDKVWEPILFLKAPEALIGPDETLRYPVGLVEAVNYEPELAFVVKKTARDVPVERAHEYILGFTCGNDVTAVNLYGRDIHLARGKSFDTFCPVGPVLVTDLDVSDLAIRLWVNGTLTQEGRTSHRIWADAECLAAASRVMTLQPGDVVLTGVPWGNGPFQCGDVLEMEIEGIGRLRTPTAPRE